MKRKVVAVTGGIGSGKSSVMDILRHAGYATVDCDKLAREVAEYPEVVEEVRNLLGGGYVTDGRLNRRAIRDRVFSDDRLLARYNALFFDNTLRLLKERIEEIQGDVFVEISVFYAFEYPWDEVWLVTSDEQERKRRVMARDGVSAISADEIISRQRICSDYTVNIVNDGDLELLRRRVEQAIAETLAR